MRSELEKGTFCELTKGRRFSLSKFVSVLNLFCDYVSIIILGYDLFEILSKTIQINPKSSLSIILYPQSLPRNNHHSCSCISPCLFQKAFIECICTQMCIFKNINYKCYYYTLICYFSINIL